MKVTLFDGQGGELTEITSHFAGSPCHLLVDWATRPDALFAYYFGEGSRTVTAVIGAGTWSAVLGTRCQMGARFWYLHEFLPVDVPAEVADPATHIFAAQAASEHTTPRSVAAFDAPAVQRASGVQA